MKEYTQADFDTFEVIDGIKQFPSGDYSDIQIFGEWCSFGEDCFFGEECSFEGKGEYIGDYPFLAFVGFGSRIGSKVYFFNLQDGFYAVEPVAHPDGDRRRKRPNEQKPLPECVGTSDAGNGVENGIVAYSDRQRCEECNASSQSGHTQGRTIQEGDAKRRIPDWNGFPTQPPVCGGDDGFPGELVGIAFPRWCREAVKACGNAIVPQVALRIFETINEYEKI